MTGAQRFMLFELKRAYPKSVVVTGRRERPVVALAAAGLARVLREWNEGGELGISSRHCIEVVLAKRTS